MINKIDGIFCIPDDYDYLMAELYADDVQWGEINQESGEPVIQIYRGNGQENLEMKLDELLGFLMRARSRFTNKELKY